MLEIKNYRNFLSMVEILAARTLYDDMIHENKIYVNKSLMKLNRESAPKIVKYFNKGKHPMANSIINLCNYYLELLKYEKLEIT